MGILGQKKLGQELTPAQYERQLAESREHNQFLLHVTRSLLFFLKEFSFDLSEIDAGGYKRRIDEMVKIFTPDESHAKQRHTFDRSKQAIIDFSSREKAYFTEKEQELKKIITMLRGALTDIHGDNQAFNHQLHERNLKLEQITYLNDIRMVKEQLKVEVDLMKKSLQEKQSKEHSKLELLSKQVDILKTDLEKVTDASHLDALTGACNRLAFETQIKRVIERTIATTHNLSIVMCDIDNFKGINDMYGHRVGDRVLKCFVQECRSLFRSTDYIVRYGGDEFVIVMPNTPLRNAISRARALNKALSTKKYMIDSTRPKETIIFTASIGVSEVCKNDCLEALINRADQALYAAKHRGKNLVVSEQAVKVAAPLAVR